MEIDDIVKTIDEEEATRTKNVIAGTSDFVKAPLILYSPSEGFQHVKDQNYIPALFTVINEALVNCCDHAIACINKRTIQHKLGKKSQQRFVDCISVKLDKNGAIVIENDGYGIPIITKRNGVYLPIELFTVQRTGENTEKDKFRICAGTNGSGAKIITSYSSVTKIECQDDKHYFIVRITADEKGRKTIGEPIITPAKDDNQFTRVSFRIDWEHTKFKKFSEATFKLFNAWIRTRCVHVSLYLNQYRPCVVKYNNKEYKMICSDIPMNYIYSTKLVMKIKNDKLLGYNNTIFGNCVAHLFFISEGKPLKLSIINGIEITSNPILDDIIKKLYGIVKADVMSNAKVELTKATFTSRLVIIFIGTIMNPQWVGQTKHGITRSDKLTEMYSIDYSVAKELSQVFTEHTITKQAKVVQTKFKTAAKNDKYFPALDIRNGVKSVKYLWLAEGDSAMAFVKGILGKKYKFDFNNSGMLSLGGVIINTYNRIKSHNPKDFKFVKDQTKPMLVMDKKCMENVFITTFIQAMGIKMDCEYKEEKEINSLKYKYIIIATDQDKDGYNINGLLLVLFSKWPGLFKYGRILRLQTPVARVKPASLTKDNLSKSIEFFSESELEEYLAGNKIPKGFKVKYYKGLSGHELEYITPIAASIDKYLYTFISSKRSEELLGIYYNKENPDLRKEELKTPLRKMIAKEISLYKQKKITISTYLQIYVKDYQLDNLSRKLVKVLDGQNNVCGKLIYAVPIAIKSNEIKVSVLGSKIIELTNYHHGEASINETIFKNAQGFPGKKLYPMLKGFGETGTRCNGGKDHGSARYITTTLNRRFYEAMFRREDEILLEYIHSEDSVIEPKYYYPVLPLAIMENYKTTAHGWKIEIWGRDLMHLKKAMQMLLNDKIPTNELPINQKISASKFIVLTTDGKDRIVYSKGSYKIIKCGNKLDMHITDLPVGVWPAKYVQELQSKIVEGKTLHEIIDCNEEIYNTSEGNNVNILIRLTNNWESKVPKYNDSNFTDVEIAFGLRVRLCDELNFISPEGGVVSFDRYIDFLVYWFNIRKQYYMLRIQRQIEILKNQIAEATNRRNYLKNFHTWGLSKRLTKQQAHQIMENNGLIKINKSLVVPEYFVPTEKIQLFMTIQSSDVDPVFDELHKQELIRGYASYEYLDSIRNDHVRAENMEPLEKKITELELELEKLLRSNAWKHIWAEEIKHLVSILQEIA